MCAGAARGGGRAMARPVLRSPGRAWNCSLKSISAPLPCCYKVYSVVLFLMEKGGSERTPLQPPGTARRWSGAFGSSLVPVNRSVIALGLMAPRALGEPVVQDEVVPICA